MISKFFQHLTPFSASFPFNFNWQSLGKKVASIAKMESPIIVFDIGARGGEIEELESLYKYIDYVGFDADEKAANQMRSSLLKRYKNGSVFPYFVGKDNDSFIFYLYEYAGLSSRLQPSRWYTQRFENKGFKVRETFNVKSQSLDSIIIKEKISFPDVIKLDTQGTEFEILESSPKLLDNVMFIQCEMMFNPMYENQKMFYDICHLLYKNKFELLYINRAVCNRKSFYGESRGELIWGDFLFCKNDEIVSTRSKDDIIKYIVLLSNYGYPDIAYDVLIRSGKFSQSEINSIASKFTFYSNSLLGKVYRAMFGQAHKLIIILLRLLKTNKEQYDYDKSWNYR